LLKQITNVQSTLEGCFATLSALHGLRRVARPLFKDCRMAQVAAISQQIWDMKYRFKGPDGAPIDKTIEDSWRRVADALAATEEPEACATWSDAFYEALSGFKYLPAGRILAGAGTKRSVTLFNCFVMGTIPDDMS